MSKWTIIFCHKHMPCCFIEASNNGKFIGCNNLEKALKFNSKKSAMSWALDNIRYSEALIDNEHLFFMRIERS